MRRTLTAIALLVSGCCDGTELQGSDLHASARPSEPAYRPGEPIWIEVHFENRGQAPITIELWRGIVGELRCKARDGLGKHRRVERLLSGGVIRVRRVELAPGRSVSYHVLLNRDLILSTAGTWDVEIDLNAPPYKGTVKSSVYMQHPLSEQLRDWSHKAERGGAVNGPEERARLSIVHTVSREAIPYQDKLLDRIFSDEHNVCLQSMLAASSDDAVALLVKRLDNPTGNKGVKMAILYAIKKYGWRNLSPESKKVLAKYEEAIANAASITIDD